MADRVVADRIGISRLDGSVLTDWAHCIQSIWDIITTRIGTRVMRLEYGGEVPALLDRPGNALVLASWYGAITTALIKWEPGFQISSFSLEGAGPDGHYTLLISGLFYPRGHLGDYSIVQDASNRFLVAVQD